MKDIIINSIVGVTLLANPTLVVFAQDASSEPVQIAPVRELRDQAIEERQELMEKQREFMEEVMEERKGVIDSFRGELEEIRESAADRMEVMETREEAVRALRTDLGRTAAEKREFLEAQREERKAMIERQREELKTRIEEAREEAKMRVEERKEELRRKLEEIRDERKRETVDRLDDRFGEINIRFTNHLLSALTRLEELAAKISSRADKAEVNGVDVSAARAAVERAYESIAAARSALEEQLAKTYPIEVTSEEALRSAVAEARNLLNQDLREMKELVRSAHQHLVEALRNLKAVPEVDEFNGDSSEDDSDEEQATSSEEEAEDSE